MEKQMVVRLFLWHHLVLFTLPITSPQWKVGWCHLLFLDSINLQEVLLGGAGIAIAWGNAICLLMEHAAIALVSG